ncbi:class F sortase [Streptacidiphilus sp. MAP5-3]|uniref:class F sortase n=1 Tax=unclassified Streptacidiphilus TaxID=2643834 RepID=UPI0035156162
MRFYDDPLDQDDDLRPSEPAPAPNARRSRRMLVALLLPFLLSAWMMWDGTRTAHPPTRVAAQAAPSTGRGSASHPYASTSLAPTRPPAPMLLPLAWSPPTRITIPAIGLAAPVAPLGLDRSGELSAPAAPSAPATPGDRIPEVAGWYKDGVAPGQPGNALMVLSQLGSLRTGHQIEVRRQDGRTAVFSVDAVGPYAGNAGNAGNAKNVTNSATAPELRLVTSSSSDTSDIVVDARLVAVR